MELLCFSPEGFDPFPFVPQIKTRVARLGKGAGVLPELVIFSLPITMELESYDTYITTQQHNYTAVCVTVVSSWGSPLHAALPYLLILPIKTDAHDWPLAPRCRYIVSKPLLISWELRKNAGAPLLLVPSDPSPIF